ncbi:MAG: hypothetical protein QOC95_358 [Thermoleophilaceae bacterium]|nr:hypothetical protein [Thermoleophilaceae bacterium]
MSRVISAVSAAGGKAAVESALTRELRRFTGATAALLLAVDARGRVARPAAGDPELPQPHENVALDDAPAIGDALTAELAIRIDSQAALALARAISLPDARAGALLLPLRPAGGEDDYVLVLAGGAVRSLGVEDVEAAAACLSAASASLGHVTMLEHGAEDAARHSALARAAKALNESLDLSRVLPRICQEAAAILTADAVAVYRGSVGRALVLEAAHPSAGSVGARVEPGAGIAGRAIELGRPLMARDLGPEDVAGTGVRSALAVPMRWDGEARGVLWVGFGDAAGATEQDLALLESFAELAAVACRNASVHAGLAEAARTDGLTGCLNHAALHETLRREMQRSRRTGRRLSIVLVDLDHFKQVNEHHGHLMGDEVLRRVGRALREAVRPYDFVARYGGDEFAIIAVDAQEQRAAEIGDRAIDRLGAAVKEVLAEEVDSWATAGVAQWSGAVSSSDLVREADRALLYGKQQGVRGRSVLATAVPPSFALGRPLGDGDLAVDGTGGAAAWPSAVRQETEPLRKRSRQLTLANSLGVRIAALTRVDDIVRATVDELHGPFGYLAAGVVQPRAGRSMDGRRSDVAERCLAERVPVRADTELAVPVWVGSELWGALEVKERPPNAFEEVDVSVLEAVADQLGSAVHSATLYEQLERAYLSTSEALADALEAKDALTGEHARSIVRNAEAVGRRLGMSPDDLRDLRYAAAFHDIGKIAVSERILNKPGPLTESEKREVEQHTVLGVKILSEVDFLSGVLPLVRHCHEHWDGGGYPDGLAGDRIPLGARVILVCDAHDAMTADRPYRRALPPDAARAEIRSAVGRQFDSRVASAFLEAVGPRRTPVA